MLGVLLSQRIGCGKAYATGIVARIRKILDLLLDYADSPIHKRLSAKELKLGETTPVCYHCPLRVQNFPQNSRPTFLYKLPSCPLIPIPPVPAALPRK